MLPSSQMRLPRDETGLGTIIHGSAKILLDEIYRQEFCMLLSGKRTPDMDILVLAYL